MEGVNRSHRRRLALARARLSRALSTLKRAFTSDEDVTVNTGPAELAEAETLAREAASLRGGVARRSVVEDAAAQDDRRRRRRGGGRRRAGATAPGPPRGAGLHPGGAAPGALSRAVGARPRDRHPAGLSVIEVGAGDGAAGG